MFLPDYPGSDLLIELGTWPEVTAVKGLSFLLLPVPYSSVSLFTGAGHEYRFFLFFSPTIKTSVPPERYYDIDILKSSIDPRRSYDFVMSRSTRNIFTTCSKHVQISISHFVGSSIQALISNPCREMHAGVMRYHSVCCFVARFSYAVARFCKSVKQLMERYMYGLRVVGITCM